MERSPILTAGSAKIKGIATRSRINVRNLTQFFRLLGPLLFAVLYFYKTQQQGISEQPQAELILDNRLPEDLNDLVEVPSFDEQIVQVEPTQEDAVEAEVVGIPDRGDYREISSISTKNRKFAPIYFSRDGLYNPSVVPHPMKHDLWVVVAQHELSDETTTVSQQLMCSAGFMDDVLVCTAEPTVIPAEPPIKGQCSGSLAYLNHLSGPRETCMFYGPDVPYLTYSSPSQNSCIGNWAQDARSLLDPFHISQDIRGSLFRHTTEVQRPSNSPKKTEMKTFIFWDGEDNMYAHHDLWPKRSFSKLNYDGSIGPNLAEDTLFHDQTCMAQYMPRVALTQESIHQATNSLRITLCKREDPGCTASDSNTFIMHIFHHKSNYDEHAEYEPYVVLFQQSAPFALYAISQRPLWINGRDALTLVTGSAHYRGREDKIPQGHTESFHITSISWKTHGQKYHGYIDDPIFLSFGIEDTKSGLIDVRADDLLQDLAFCDK